MSKLNSNKYKFLKQLYYKNDQLKSKINCPNDYLYLMETIFKMNPIQKINSFLVNLKLKINLLSQKTFNLNRIFKLAIISINNFLINWKWTKSNK